MVEVNKALAALGGEICRVYNECHGSAFGRQGSPPAVVPSGITNYIALNDQITRYVSVRNFDVCVLVDIRVVEILV